MSKEQEIPPPLLLSAIVCDRVIMDNMTQTPSIISIIHTISAPRYPARHYRLTFFCELTNGRDKMQITIRLVDVQQEDKTMFEQTVEQEFRDIKQVAALTFGVEGIIFPHPGEYRMQIYAGTHLLGERRIICRQIELPLRGANNESKNG